MSIFTWWVEGVAEHILGLVGITANCLAVPVLLSKQLGSTFNR